jgi:hypothetical protein
MVDRYTKALLAVIAIALVVLAAENSLPAARAQPSERCGNPSNPCYVVAPPGRPVYVEVNPKSGIYVATIPGQPLEVKVHPSN